MPCVASSSRLFIPPSLNLRVFEEKSPRKFLFKHIDHNKNQKKRTKNTFWLTNKTCQPFWQNASIFFSRICLFFSYLRPWHRCFPPGNPWRHWPSCLPVQRHQQRRHLRLRSGRMQRPTEACRKNLRRSWSSDPYQPRLRWFIGDFYGFLIPTWGIQIFRIFE